tara:strand:+ start:257 stop:583 length:327 start_codon:yes stop_codon:yes gene_type:complete
MAISVAGGLSSSGGGGTSSRAGGMAMMQDVALWVMRRRRCVSSASPAPARLRSDAADAPLDDMAILRFDQLGAFQGERVRWFAHAAGRRADMGGHVRRAFVLIVNTVC